jgi:hypothetical protein
VKGKIMEEKSVAASKINITALIAQGVSIAAMLGYIPEEHKDAVLEAALVILPFAIQVFRTFYTKAQLRFGAR